MFVGLADFDGIQGYEGARTRSALHCDSDVGRGVYTASEGILLGLADIVCYLDSSTMVTGIPVEVQV